jgi:hypothetical protein
MATERQITANRRNARKSTGPRSGTGKRRVSRNSFRHGLSVGVAASAEFAKRVDTLADKIAGKGADANILALSRAAAHAEHDLAQIRRVKVALINRMLDFGEFEVPNPVGTCRQIKRALTLIAQGLPWDKPFLRDPNCPLQNRSAQLKPCAGRCRNWSSLTVTRDAPPPGATAPRVSSSLEKNP